MLIEYIKSFVHWADSDMKLSVRASGFAWKTEDISESTVISGQQD